MDMTGRILKGIGGFYYVDTGEKIVECRARGKFRKLGISPLAGDWADITVSPDGSGYLMELHPRKNKLIRPPVANLDMLVIVASQAAPVTDTFLIDRVTAIAVSQQITPVIVVNKCDLASGEELERIYKKVGFPVFCVSANTGEGTDELLCALRGKFSAFTGNSGVGKSTLLNRIKPDLELKTGEINDKIGRGRHTTRQVEIIRIEENTWIADTPGFSAFDTGRMEITDKEKLQYLFPEFEKYIDDCAFQGCAHLKDKGCAVRSALERGEISESRMDSYERLYEIIKEIPEWEQRRAGRERK